MADDAEMKQRLWKELDGTGMLGNVDAHDHFQPMTAHPEEGESALYFFALKDSDFVSKINGSAKVMFTVQQKDFWACVGGVITEAFDRARMDKYWNPIVAAWYPEGKDDPNLTLLKLSASDAEVWTQKAGPVRFAYEIAKANATKTTPDLGDKAHVNL